MKSSLFLIMAGVLVLVSSCTRDRQSTSHTGGDSLGAASWKEYYTCPMHPSVMSDRPGACPVCGMALVKKSTQKEVSSAELALIRSVSLSPTQRVIANVTTEAARRRSFSYPVNTVGVVAYAEPLEAEVTARFRGRIEKLYADFTGEIVEKGQPLLELYSPDLVSAEQELLLGLKASDSSTPTGLNGENQRQLLQATRDQLRIHFGLTPQQISEIESTKQVRSTLAFFSPIHGTIIRKEVQEGQYVDEGMLLYQLVDLSRVWIYLDVYEKDLRFVKLGQSVSITSESYPGEPFSGKVTFIDPVITSDTRTVRVRTEFENASGRLKPQMYVRARINVPVENALVVPSSAVLSTGRRDIVWIEVQPNVFEPRDVVLGARTESVCEVLSGLTPGESVVVTGGFLLESESQLQHAGAADSVPKGTAAAQPVVPSHGAGSGAAEITVLVNGRFVPDVIHVKRGKTVRLKFYRELEAGCVNEVVFKTLNVRRSLAPQTTTVVELTPMQPGDIPFACGMDMVKGTIVVDH